MARCPGVVVKVGVDTRGQLTGAAVGLEPGAHVVGAASVAAESSTGLGASASDQTPRTLSSTAPRTRSSFAGEIVATGREHRLDLGDPREQ